MDIGYAASWVTIVGVVLSFLGVTGIDSSVISQAVTGVIALVTVGSAVYSHYKRPTQQ